MVKRFFMFYLVIVIAVALLMIGVFAGGRISSALLNRNSDGGNENKAQVIENAGDMVNLINRQGPNKVYFVPRYVIQEGTPAWVGNFAHPEVGCSWLGVGGQIFDLKSNPITGLIVEAVGTLEGKDILYLAITGASPALGPGGYEIKLGGTPVDSKSKIRLIVYDTSGNQISGQIYLDTYAACDKNMLILNLVEIESTAFKYNLFFPSILKPR